MVEFGILFSGIVLFILGKTSLNKFEKNRTDKGNNSGVFFQLNTILMLSGFALILSSILMFVLNN